MFERDPENKPKAPSRPSRQTEAQATADPPLPQDPLARITYRAGNPGSINAHAAILNRATASRPSQARQSLLQLQRQYGNRYVQRVVDLVRKGEGDAEVSPVVEQAIQRARGRGQALDSGVRTQMESAFGADFSGVRVHTGSEADTLNRALNARAFTTGQDIFFRQGDYNPGGSGGRKLLAHELTHVVQQGGAGIQGKLTVSQPGDHYEMEADRVAEELMRMPAPEPQKQVDEEDEELLQIELLAPSRFNAVSSGGRLPDQARRSYFEPLFGHNFNNVCVHTGVEAVESARRLAAHPYTVGSNIVFADGQYRTETAASQSLLVHEPAHVVQQATPSGTERTTNDPGTFATHIALREAGEQPSPLAEFEAVRCAANEGGTTPVLKPGRVSRGDWAQQRTARRQGNHFADEVSGPSPRSPATAVAVANAAVHRDAHSVASLQPLIGNTATTNLLLSRHRPRVEGPIVHNSPTGAINITPSRVVLHREISRDVENVWGFRVSGEASLTTADQTQAEPVTSRPLELKLPPGAEEGVLKINLTLQRYRWSRTFRWQDREKRDVLGTRREFEARFTIDREDGDVVARLEWNSDREIDLGGPFSEPLYQIDPSATGNLAKLVVRGFGRGKGGPFSRGDRQEAQVEVAVRVEPAMPEVEIGPVWVRRELVLRGFPIGSARLTDAHYDELTEFWDGLSEVTKDAIRNHRLETGRHVEVHGWTSTTDRRARNQELSIRRAQTVARFIKHQGVRISENIALYGRGEFPAVTDDPAEEREDAQHRAVVVILWEPSADWRGTAAD